MPLRALALELLVALAWVFHPSLAVADCVGQRPALLWSYPADGAVNVPTNADLFFTGDLPYVPWRNAVPLDEHRIAPGVYDLGELLPQTTYGISWGSIAAITFTTGDGPSPTGPVAELGLDRDPERRSCNLIQTGSCSGYGSGPYVVQLEADTIAVATLVELVSCDGSVRSVLWPAECGQPLVGQSDSIVCVRARTTSGADLSEPTELVCSLPSDEERGQSWYTPSECAGDWPPAEARISHESTDAGCALSPPRGGCRAWLFLPALLGLIIASRRHARRRR